MSKNKRRCKKKGSISMKILMLTWEYPPRVVGGISRVVYDLSKTLLKDGHDVTVVTYRDGDAPYFEDDKGVKVYRVDNSMINPNNFIDWILQLNFAMVAKVNEIIAPIFYTVPMQLLSYHVALIKGTDVDQPRNLAKSVTVE